MNSCRRLLSRGDRRESRLPPCRSSRSRGDRGRIFSPSRSSNDVFTDSLAGFSLISRNKDLKRVC